MPSCFGDVAIAQALVEHQDELLLPLGELGLRPVDFLLVQLALGAEQGLEGGADLGGAG
jgi:hypothetical protein